MIRKEDDTAVMAEIWLETSIAAHDFIPSGFWRDRFTDMRDKYLPMSDNYSFVGDDGIVKGFISFSGEGHIEALFVTPGQQGKGIGTALLRFAVEKFNTLTLSVYKDNRRSVGFYLNKGFVITGEGTDPHTGHAEYIMEYNGIH